MILVTGASQGIGFECAKALLERTGSRVLITGRSEARLAAARDSLPIGQRERLTVRPCDQGEAGDVESLTAFLAASAAPLEGAILAVGVNPLHEEGPSKIHALSAATVEAVIRTNCTHALRVTAAVLDRLRKQRAGVLIWIGSQAAHVGMPGAALYCATKSFLSGLARAANHEYAAHGVRVHLLHPALVRTPRTTAMAEAFAEQHGLVVGEASEAARRIVDCFLAGDPAAVEADL